MAEEKAATTGESVYATPDRDHDVAPNNHAADKKNPPTVTPLDSQQQQGTDANKQVRFGKDEKSKRGLVSRRGGGRLGSSAPPRTNTATTTTDDSNASVLEFKTYRSPQRNKRDSAVENDTIPSLCSTSSGPSKDAEKQEATSAADDGARDDVARTDRPSSISCDPSMIATTSPLASQDVDASPLAQKASNVATTPPKEKGERRNVTFSPPTPHFDVPKKTPNKSPLPGQFQSLPSLQEGAKLTPSGIFLSPEPPSPSTYAGLSSVPTLEKGSEKKNSEKKENDDAKPEAKDEKKLEAKKRDQERERAVATPTDFALDFGKGLRPTGSFDTSNVLSWLQSPTAMNGLFSPGGGLGLGSALNTPRAGAAAPRTPRTPTTSTSFFFSDVASLPRNNDFGSPKGENVAGKRSGINGPQGVYSSMICISPLSSKRRQGTSQPQTPMNYNDVFASPRERQDQRRGNIPYLGDSPSKGKSRSANKDGNLDAHFAERDLMEDEDLSVLLQLASHSNTPGRSREGGPHVFRSPHAGEQAQEAAGSGLPGGLQLPVIGGHGDSSAKLSRKPNSREQGGNGEDFKAPQLAIRSSSSSGSKEIYRGGSKQNENRDGKGKPSSNPADGDDRGTSTTSNTTPKKSGSRKTPTYLPPPYPHPSEPPMSYYPMASSGVPSMQGAGSMRVVVGGPPPPMPPSARSKGKGSSPSRHGGSPSRRPPYPMHPPQGDGRYPGMPYPHHGVGVYPPPPHISGMNVPPHAYPGHYPPPPPPHHPSHMQMYPHLPPQAPAAEKKTKTKAKTAKRQPTAPPGKTPTKKPKKSPSKTPRKRSKTQTPTSANPADRQKTAAAIRAVNVASGGKNDKAAALAAAILRGVTMRPSGKWQAQLYYAGKSRYIGVFDTREKAALAYEIAREKLKADKIPNDNSSQSLKATEAAVNAARKAAFDGVNEKDPRLSK